MTLATPEDNAGASISNGLDRQTGLTAEIDAKGLSGAVANRAGRSGPRFSIIPGNAVFDENLTLTGFRLLCYLGRHTNNAGWCRIKQRKIAADLGIARSTVQIHLDQLYKLGWVEKRAEGWTGVGPGPGRPTVRLSLLPRLYGGVGYRGRSCPHRRRGARRRARQIGHHVPDIWTRHMNVLPVTILRESARELIGKRFPSRVSWTCGRHRSAIA